MVWFPDDASAFGDVEARTRWWDTLMQIGPNYGYYPQPTKLQKNPSGSDKIR